MTVTIDQAMRGAVRFADTEIIPHLPSGKGIGAGVALALIMDGGRDYILGLRDNPAVKLMRIYFVAETKGSMSSMQLRLIEESKIHCAREHFKAISSDSVVYDVVDSYKSLMELAQVL